MMGGQHASPEAIRAINKDLGLDLPFHQQYLLYLNDLSPISVHNTENEESYIHLEKDKYSHFQLFSIGSNKVLVLKAPYLRRSYQSKQLVSTIIMERLPGTLILALTSIVLATILGVLLGITAAINKGSFLDNFSLSFSVLGMSGPSYFTGLIIAYLFGSLWTDTTSLPTLPFVFLFGGLLIGAFLDPYLEQKREGRKWNFSTATTLKRGFQALGLGVGVWLLGVSINGLVSGSPVPFLHHYFHLPGTGLSSSGSMYEYSLAEGEYLALQNLILPALALGIRPLAIVVQLTRSSMLDVLSQDYIRTATAKGLSRKRIILKHALKNALNPVVTAISGWFALMMAGAIFIEYIFSWRGLGWEVFQALQKDDMPVVMGVVLVIAFMFVIINILVDIIYGFLDPRVRMR
jgi:ABC-type dipeptide/oligopeptide/nickel transport system permease component